MCRGIIRWRGGSRFHRRHWPSILHSAGGGDDYEIQEVLDTLGVQPNVQYRVQQDQVILAMVSCGLGISIMEELMLDRNEYPVVACSFAKPFYRNIGICVKDKRAISRSTYRFVEHVRRWVLEKYSG